MLPRAVRWAASHHVAPVVLWSYTLADGVPMLATCWRSGAAVLIWGLIVGAVAWECDRRALAELAAVEAERGR